MAFTAKDVASLREKTGCGMMDCKKALTATDGDFDKAIDFLREKGLATAAKKAGRIAADGLVYTFATKEAGVIVEVNSETDFVAKNAEFRAFVEGIANTILAQRPADVDALNDMKFNGTDITVAEETREKILVIGENIKIRRFEVYDGVVETYIHGGGRIGVMVLFDTDCVGKEGFDAYAKDVAMQIAALAPKYLAKEDVPADVIDHEKEVQMAAAINEGKPANIAEKMVMGRIQKYFKEVCLLEQPFVKDDKISVGKYTADTAKALGGRITLKKMVRFEKGEGLQKREDNLADEVAKMINH